MCGFTQKLLQDYTESASTDTQDPKAHESEPEDLSVGISIKNLTKVYDKVRNIQHHCSTFHQQ